MKEISKETLISLIEKNSQVEDFVYTKQEILVDIKFLSLKKRNIYVPDNGKYSFLILDIDNDDNIKMMTLCYDKDFSKEVINLILHYHSQNKKIEFACLLDDNIYDTIKKEIPENLIHNEIKNCSYCYKADDYNGFDDIDCVREITKDNYNLIMTMEDPDSGLEQFFNRIFITQQLKNERLYCLIKESRVVGYLMRHPIDEKFHDVGYVYVDPKYRNKGYGKTLLKGFISSVKKENINPFYGFAENDISRKTALSVGFVPCAESWSIIIQ